MLRFLKKLIPRPLFNALAPAYHYALALAGAVYYRFPSRHIYVIGVTGTKGKSSTVEYINAILEEAGYKTAVASTIRFKIGANSRPNLFKMTMPGRFFMQQFFREAVDAKCGYAVIEMTSEGAKQFRHKFIDLDSLVFINLSPEHIESHGSYEKYVDAKLSIARELARSSKKEKTLIVNTDDAEASKFLAISGVEHIPYDLSMAKPLTLSASGSQISYEGEQIEVKLPGEFNIYNALAALTVGKTQKIPLKTMRKAVESVRLIPGRLEKVTLEHKTFPFSVIVDYAHTADSLEKLYTAYKDAKKICVLGSTGGGRDAWKRPVMGEVADKHCHEIILTNEDPYDENPEKIIADVKAGIRQTPCDIILDRREAIRLAIKKATPGSVVLITGKGTDPYIMGPRGTKTPWSDANVVREELEKIEI